MSIENFIAQVRQRQQQALSRIARVPIAALIWGPNPGLNTPVANCRKIVKETLSNDGVYACYSEDLFDPTLSYSNVAQQVAQAEAFDLVISIPDSPGSIAEIHDFAIIPGVSNKIVTFLDERWNNGYANSSLIRLQSTVSCRVQLYNPDNLPDCIVSESVKLVQTLRETLYLLGRRD